MRSHGLTDLHAIIRRPGERASSAEDKSEAARIAIKLRLPERVSDIGVASVWLPHEIDDDLARRTAHAFAADVDLWLYWRRGLRSPKTGGTPSWYDPEMRLGADPPAPPVPAKPPLSKRELAERELARCLEGHRRAVARVRRATRLEAKWFLKVKRAERKAARFAQDTAQETSA